MSASGFREPPIPSSSAAPLVRPVTLGELAADLALLAGRPLEVGAQRVVRLDRLAPPLHATGGLEARDGGDEVAARQPVRRRERLAVGCVGRLLRHRRAAERAADDDAPESPRLAAELSGDDVPIVHA